mmetsp:Transcript_19539/g.57921  ORF Transcript_19539/g.57921 Transcript_19539/m.57921 type:complete len:663 (-) Transcript_19539:358-2346(-)
MLAVSIGGLRQRARRLHHHHPVVVVALLLLHQLLLHDLLGATCHAALADPAPSAAQPVPTWEHQQPRQPPVVGGKDVHVDVHCIAAYDVVDLDTRRAPRDLEVVREVRSAAANLRLPLLGLLLVKVKQHADAGHPVAQHVRAAAPRLVFAAARAVRRNARADGRHLEGAHACRLLQPHAHTRGALLQRAARAEARKHEARACVVVLRDEAVAERVELPLVQHVLQVRPQQLKRRGQRRHVLRPKRRHRVHQAGARLALQTRARLVLLHRQVQVERHAAPTVTVEELRLVVRHKAGDGVLVLESIVVERRHDLPVGLRDGVTVSVVSAILRVDSKPEVEALGHVALVAGTSHHLQVLVLKRVLVRALQALQAAQHGIVLLLRDGIALHREAVHEAVVHVLVLLGLLVVRLHVQRVIHRTPHLGLEHTLRHLLHEEGDRRQTRPHELLEHVHLLRLHRLGRIFPRNLVAEQRLGLLVQAVADQLHVERLLPGNLVLAVEDNGLPKAVGRAVGVRLHQVHRVAHLHVAGGLAHHLHHDVAALAAVQVVLRAQHATCRVRVCQDDHELTPHLWPQHLVHEPQQVELSKRWPRGIEAIDVENKVGLVPVVRRLDLLEQLLVGQLARVGRVQAGRVDERERDAVNRALDNTHPSRRVRRRRRAARAPP